ncbi:MAG TPA: tetratricopeptide repeat protein [Candidatus Dormibacteraeota bacterium]|nr:tetratricopeptide repeat protein [Candidatus Dormibacteraeota bacterium]
MRELRSSFLLVFMVASLALAAHARAAGTSPEPRTPPPTQAMPGSAFPSKDSTAAPGRAEAEKVYAKGWDLAQQAKQELATGKSDSAKKRFGKALKKFKEATDIDPSYYQAWNMVGFCSRKSGDLKRSFEAYAKCIEIEPEYAPAHEYLGEAYLMAGDPAKAKEQLLWLVSRKSKDEIATLTQSIEAYEKSGTTGAASDSMAKGGGW